MTCSSKFKVPSANLQTISSYLVQIFHKYYLFFFSLFYFFVFLFFVETKILYIPIHIWLCSRMSEKKKKLPVWFLETKLLLLFEHISYKEFFKKYFQRKQLSKFFLFLQHLEGKHRKDGYICANKKEFISCCICNFLENRNAFKYIQGQS